MKTQFTILLFSLSLFVISCSPKQTAQEDDQTVYVKTVPVSLTEVSIPVVSSGIILSEKEARLSFKTGGIITRLFVNEGDKVTKGQLLGSLDLTEISAQVEQAKNGFEKSKRDYERVSSLYKDNSATLEQFQNAKTGLDVAEQTFKIAQFNLQYSSIYATETGRVLNKLMNEGELAGPGTPVYIINSTKENDWSIKIGVSDKDWAKLSIGDKADLFLDAYPSQKISATVSEIGEATDPYTGTFQIKLKVGQTQLKLANGLIAKIEIHPSRTDKYYMVPIEALIESDKKSGTVFSVNADGKSVSKFSVTISQILKDQVAVSDGLQNVKSVVTDGVSYLTETSSVKIVNEPINLTAKL